MASYIRYYIDEHGTEHEIRVNDTPVLEEDRADMLFNQAIAAAHLAQDMDSKPVQETDYEIQQRGDPYNSNNDIWVILVGGAMLGLLILIYWPVIQSYL